MKREGEENEGIWIGSWIGLILVGGLNTFKEHVTCELGTAPYTNYETTNSSQLLAYKGEEIIGYLIVLNSILRQFGLLVRHDILYLHRKRGRPLILVTYQSCPHGVNSSTPSFSSYSLIDSSLTSVFLSGCY